MKHLITVLLVIVLIILIADFACSSAYEKVYLGTQIFMTFGTIAVALLAIYGEWIKFYLYPPQLDIQCHELGELASWPESGRKSIFYHLRVVNNRKWAPARNCRVLMTEIQHQDADGKFPVKRFLTPKVFFWAPQFEGQSRADIFTERVIDLAQLPEGDNLWVTLLRIQPSDEMKIPKGAIRIVLHLVADNYNTPNRHVFEIRWDGEWHYDINEMSRHLTIEKVADKKLLTS